VSILLLSSIEDERLNWRCFSAHTEITLLDVFCKIWLYFRVEHGLTRRGTWGFSLTPTITDASTWNKWRAMIFSGVFIIFATNEITWNIYWTQRQIAKFMTHFEVWLDCAPVTFSWKWSHHRVQHTSNRGGAHGRVTSFQVFRQQHRMQKEVHQQKTLTKIM
jgi:hypothetical protein